MSKFTFMIAGGLAASLLAPVATAGYSSIGSPFGFELGHREIVENIYGGTFVKNGTSFSNGTITATRVDDILDPIGQMDLVFGSAGAAADQNWGGSLVTATAKARFAGRTQSFGYYDQSDNSYSTLFDVSGYGMAVTGSAEVDLTGLDIAWGRTDVGGANDFTSVSLDNIDAVDHMVAYHVTGLDDGRTTWLLFWEDIAMIDGRIPDYDYNDLVVEISAAAVPAPSVLAALGAGLLVGRRRRRAA